MGCSPWGCRVRHDLVTKQQDNECFFPKISNKVKMSPLVLFNTVLDSQLLQLRQKKSIQMGKKEEIKLALFMDNMIISIEYTKEPTKKAPRISE